MTKTMEEEMTVVECQRADEKSTLNERNISDAGSPFKDESKMMQGEECKQTDKQNTDKENKVENGDSAATDSDAPEGRRKRKHRRRQRGGKNHRRWKPYDKMSWTEKQALEEKETKRANQKRENAFASGHPVAPYNTTQFLMDDHCKNEAISPDLYRYNSKDSNASNYSDSSSDFYDEGNDDDFLERNFQDQFNDFRMQQLMDKTKESLVREYVQLEMKLESLESVERKSGSGSRSGSESLNSSTDKDTEMDTGKASELFNMEEFKRLKAENDNLRLQNKSLLTILGKTDGIQSTEKC
ncbi:HEXI1-like protein [Mya arenaria]|uniref:HEXI1-like protein n=1 Tax=Mya arenaria TaxID=6604 RepID=A0ABY7E908_MYAAR|nr:protein HEXIM1-like [Mya arenaria]WAR06543.1 HEXI1-like protein [Mya arenaria]